MKRRLFNDLNQTKKIELFDFFFNQIESTGFGVLSKSDLELLIFQTILNSGLYEGVSDFRLGVSLGVTSNKVRALRDRAAAKFDTRSQSDALLQFFNSINPSMIELSGTNLIVRFDQLADYRIIEDFCKTESIYHKKVPDNYYLSFTVSSFMMLVVKSTIILNSKIDIITILQGLFLQLQVDQEIIDEFKEKFSSDSKKDKMLILDTISKFITTVDILFSILNGIQEART